MSHYTITNRIVVWNSDV